ncbi:MAG: glycosyltransferase family 4 protein [Candidatus Eiseniibacteriota bacterium]
MSSDEARRILVVADAFPPVGGSAPAVLAETLRHLPKRGLVISTPRRGGSFAVDRRLGGTVRRAITLVGPQGFGLRLWKAHLAWLAGQRPPAVVVACGLEPDAFLAQELFREKGVPFVLRFGLEDLLSLRREILAGGERGRRFQDLAEEAAAIVVPSRAAWLEAYKLRIRPHEVHEIPPGVDLETFRPGPAAEELLRRLDLGQGPVVLAFSADDPAADWESVLRAFAVIRAQHRRAVLLVRGAPVAEAKELMAGLHLEGAVRFLGPSDASVPELYRVASLFLMAHAPGPGGDPAQGLEMSFVEAMATGVPIVATRTPATAELVPDEEAGLLIEPRAHAKLGRAALEVLRSLELAEELARRGREIAESRHDVKATATALSEFLEVLLVRRLRRERPLPALAPTAAPPVT